MKVEIEQESDGNWIAETKPARSNGLRPDKTEAVAKAEALVLRILANKLEHGEAAPNY